MNEWDVRDGGLGWWANVYWYGGSGVGVGLLVALQAAAVDKVDRGGRLLAC